MKLFKLLMETAVMRKASKDAGKTSLNFRLKALSSLFTSASFVTFIWDFWFNGSWI